LEAHADSGLGVREIRIHMAGAHRVFYVTTRPEAIYVLHAFEKKMQKSSAADLRIGRAAPQSGAVEATR
jgi:phage-related protein